MHIQSLIDLKLTWCNKTFFCRDKYSFSKYSRQIFINESPDLFFFFRYILIRIFFLLSLHIRNLSLSKINISNNVILSTNVAGCFSIQAIYSFVVCNDPT